MDRIVIDQSKIRIVTEKPVRPGAEFPRPLDWWQRYVPVWLDASVDGDLIVLEPNGWCANGTRRELTPADRRRHLATAERWLGSLLFLDFTAQRGELTMPIEPGQIYRSADPRDSHREPIRVIAYDGSNRAEVADAHSGKNHRQILITSFHDNATTKAGKPRRTGYVLEEPQPPRTFA